MAETDRCVDSLELNDVEYNNACSFEKLQDHISVENHNEDIQTPSSWKYLLVLTCIVGGLQVVWSVILSNGTLFLISLGLSKSLTALIWAAAPLSGITVQPLVGVLSDTCITPWGRRRPFILAGTLGVVTSMLALAWVEDIVDLLATYLDLQDRNLDLKPLVIVIATVNVYMLNISIQPVQMGMRTLIIEQTPPAQQQRASAWASYMTGAGNILGYAFGYLEVEKIFRKPQFTHFQGLCVAASLVLSCTMLTTCFFAQERSPQFAVLRRESRRSTASKMAAVPRELVSCYKNMPQNIRKVCHIQFWTWMGWFPYLYYSTSYIKDLYIASETPSPTSQHLINSGAIRAGTLASLSFAIIALLTNISLSLFLPGLSKTFSKSVFLQPLTSNKMPRLNHSLSIIHVWASTQVFFALAMFSTFLITSWISGALLTASIGISWSLALWAPFAIIGYEIKTDMKISAAQTRTGTILSLSNVAISAPQIVAAVICSLVFSIVDVVGRVDGTVWVLRLSACVMVGAAWLTWSLEGR